MRILSFSIIAEPLTNLLSKKSKFVWSDKCQQAFNKLKTILGNTPVLLAPDINKLTVDAGDIGIGAVLLQEDDNCIDHPVCYFSKKLNKHQFSHWERLFGITFSSDTFWGLYQYFTVHPIIVFSDHNPLTFIDKVWCKNQR